MITPISSNLNNINSLQSIDRPRIPRRNNAVNNVNFTGNKKTISGKFTTKIKNFFGSIFGTIKKGALNVTHSKPIQAIKRGAVKGFNKTVDIMKSIPKIVSRFFKSITSKFSKKA